MRKSWLASILAGLLVVGVGTAIASIPNGSNTSFNVQDPAVTAIASGQSQISGEKGSPYCEFKAESLTYCPTADLTFTPRVDAICLVTANLGFVGDPMGEGPGNLDQVYYGIGLRSEEEDTIEFDEDRVGVTPNYKSMATMPRDRLIPVQGGVETTIEPYIQSEGSAHGTMYWDASYVCFG